MTVVHVKAVREREYRALLGVRLDVLFVDLRDVLIGQQDHDHISRLDRIIHLGHFQASLLHLGPRRTALTQPHHHLDAGFRQVLRVCMTLRAIADDGDILTFDEREVAVLVVENFHDVPVKK